MFRHDLLAPEVVSLYEMGLPAGASTGWPTLDKHYTVAMNQWSLVTGTPHAGKSEWLDALMVNLANASPWRFSIFSPENASPRITRRQRSWRRKSASRLAPGLTERMTPDERDAGLAWMKGRFFFMQFDEPSLASILAETSHDAFHR
jgi:twinkle protein